MDHGILNDVSHRIGDGVGIGFDPTGASDDESESSLPRDRPWRQGSDNGCCNVVQIDRSKFKGDCIQAPRGGAARPSVHARNVRFQFSELAVSFHRFNAPVMMARGVQFMGSVGGDHAARRSRARALKRSVDRTTSGLTSVGRSRPAIAPRLHSVRSSTPCETFSTGLGRF
jgi:hypothetical protein